MENSVDKVTECPICCETMQKPIIQCRAGHSMCLNCVSGLTSCPICRGEMSNTRNFNLEQLIESLEKTCKLKCGFTNKGCKFLLDPRQKAQHECECKYRTFQCEGKKFCNWKCDWRGSYSDIEKHFKDYHNNHTWMSFKTESMLTMNLEQDFLDIHIINFHNGQNYFWYKHKVDKTQQKVFWTIQMIGTQQMAGNYYYEFEIFKGPTRKFKVIEICLNDAIDARNIFESEKCVVMSFKMLRSYLNENKEISFKFRIMSIKKHSTN
ncbi:hypothetical protein WA026_000165 [Henosepilachna vigintioctopunctata]|uniref:E3 ubiquitin-protein ligase n=1 Tax=Henosepilachna vigintioctopunctata TaxID=420089 RepID=A0AAW1V552_9CUCU